MATATRKSAPRWEGTALEAIRKHRGHTLDGLSAILHAAGHAISRSTLHAWESGQRAPSEPRRKALAVALRVPVARFSRKPRLA